MQLRIAQTVGATEAEGPGKRFALWVQGCSIRCEGCCNPEMFAERGGTMSDVSRLTAIITSTKDIEGVSILGGEPFEQPAPLAELCREVRAKGLSVMVYSGYTLEQLKARHDPDVDALLREIDLLADGPYEQQHPETRRRWLGSTNQTLHFLTSRYQPDDPRFTMPNTVELRFENGQLTINGWPQAADAFRRR